MSNGAEERDNIGSDFCSSEEYMEKMLTSDDRFEDDSGEPKELDFTR